jgi:uncharacterized membrane protein HdeD (DUF308 family)
MVLVLPGLAVQQVVYIIGCAALLAGIAEIVIAVTLRRQIKHEWLLLTAGVGSALFGIYLGLVAERDIILLLRATCVYTLVSGSAITGFAIRLRTFPARRHAATA